MAYERGLNAPTRRLINQKIYIPLYRYYSSIYEAKGDEDVTCTHNLSVHTPKYIDILQILGCP